MQKGVVPLEQEAAGDRTVRVGPLVNLPTLVESLGCEAQPLLRENGFRLQDFHDPDTRAPFIRMSRLLESCVQATGCEHLGLLLGNLANLSHLGLTGFLSRSAETTGAALQVLVEHLDLHDEGGVMSLEIGTDYSSLRYSLVQAGARGTEYIYDLAAAMMYNAMRSLCGSDWRPDSVSIERSQPADPAIYQKYFNAPVYFDTAETNIAFQSHWLSSRPSSGDPLLFGYLEREARQLHENHKKRLLDTLPEAMHRALLSGEFSSNQVASALGMHERTLHRRLQTAGTSFRQELDAARRALGEELLRGTSLPVCDIATTLGYAESSGFIRAFQRWHDTSPSAWRRRLDRGGGY